MNPAAAFFFTILALQAVFTTSVVLLVSRRFPARLPVYRVLAPAAVPVLLFTLVAFSFVSAYHDFVEQTGAPLSAAFTMPLFRIFLAYAVLWLFGVILASLVIRLARR